jgi:tetratricopeptide (TPR) repeat protein
LIEDGRYQQAYQHYAKMLALFPRDTDALVNYGLLAGRLGHPEEAMDAWKRAADADPSQPNPHLYLAEAFDQRQEPAAAARHWEAYLQSAAAHPDDPAAGAGQQISGTIQLADDDVRIHRTDAARTAYLSAIGLAERAGDARLESLALAHLADLEEKNGDAKSAAKYYQRALGLDAKAGDPRSAASDWFNYGQFLRRHNLPEELAYACFLHAENLLEGAGGSDLETVKTIRRPIESRLGRKAAAWQKNLPALLARATALPTDSF